VYDKTLILTILDQLIDAAQTIQGRCQKVTKVDELLDTEEGQERLDGICMKLIAIGESLKQIDKISEHTLLAAYPAIEWRKIKGIRDFISHHYFDLDAEVIFSICQNHITPLTETLRQIRTDLVRQA